VADEWYYTNQGQQMGPVSTEELRRHALSGRLEPGDLVWKDGMPKWVPAASVSEFSRHEPAPPEPVPVPRRDAEYDRDRDRDRDREPDRRRRDYDDDRDRQRRRQRPAPRGMSTGAKVGIGLGIGGGVLLILILIVVVIVAISSRPGSGPGGATHGGRTYNDDFFPGQRRAYPVEFRGGGRAEVWVNEANFNGNNANIVVTVIDTVTNAQVANGVVDFNNGQCYLTWVPPSTRAYRIEVQNHDFRNHFLTVRHN
jgi:hypothetical protein